MASDSERTNRTALRVGVLLVVASALPWLVVVGAPFVLGATAHAAAWSGAAIALAEVFFWVGVALLGRPVWAAAKQEGWRRVPARLWSLWRT